MDGDKTIESLLDERMHLQHGASSPSSQQPSADMPPSMRKAKETTVDELLTEMNRIPLFMTSLDDTDGSEGENIQLEALKAIAYEGTRAEIAQNFREQGTELIRTEKRYLEAREYYSKAIAALRSPPPDPDSEQGPSVIEIDEEAEAKKEREIEEMCLVNRALCNLEMSSSALSPAELVLCAFLLILLGPGAENYGQCKRDCAYALRLNAKNVKAWYRAASACLALDQVDQAIDACQGGLECDAENAALTALLARSKKRRDDLAAREASRREREERRGAEKATLRQALKSRGFTTRETERPPEMPEAVIALEDPLDASSSLSFPTMLLYPLHAQTDFIKAVAEGESLSEHLSYILPLPWDEKGEYTSESVECYMETVDGGLIKAGKKLSLLKLLSSVKLEVVDGLVRVNVVPKARAAEWIADFKKRRGRS